MNHGLYLAGKRRRRKSGAGTNSPHGRIVQMKWTLVLLLVLVATAPGIGQTQEGFA